MDESNREELIRRQAKAAYNNVTTIPSAYDTPPKDMKANERNQSEIERLEKEYLARGGVITQCETGQTGYVAHKPSQPFVINPRKDARTT